MSSNQAEQEKSHSDSSINSIIEKLENEIKGENREEIINQYEQDILREDIEEISNNEKFFSLPLQNIFSIISKIDFNAIKEKEVNGELNMFTIEIIQNIIKNLMNAHSEEKETVFNFTKY